MWRLGLWSLARALTFRSSRPRLRDVAVYREMAARTFVTTGVIREESESTPVTTFPSSSAEREAARPGAQAVTETAAEAEARRKGVGRRDVEAAEREEGRWARGEETDDESHPPKLHAFALTYAFLAGLTALGIGIAGGCVAAPHAARHLPLSR